MKEKVDVEFMSEEGAYWLKRKEDSEKIIEGHKEDLKNIPKHIKFHEEIIKLADKFIKDGKRIKRRI
jgi:hypothetical protein